MAVNLRALTREGDFDQLVQDVRQAFQQPGTNYESFPIDVWRAGEYRQDHVIVRRMDGDSIAFYLKLGLAAFKIQHGWDIVRNDSPCEKQRGLSAGEELVPEFEETPAFPGEEVKPPELEDEEDNLEEDQQEPSGSAGQ
jgi:hypothetical protein